MRIREYIIAVGFLIAPIFQASAIKILFDNTKGEQSGNADWVISNATKPTQIPTPAQSGITSTTAGTYWVGAISSWGVDCVKQGYTVETLPSSGQITYGSSSNTQDLSKYQVFVVCEPNKVFSATEKIAILNFVKNGGGLFMVSDHNISDRDGDGWDSPHVWNDLMNNNTQLINPFGITFDLVNLVTPSTNMAPLPKDSVLHGKMGNVTLVEWYNGTTMTLNKTVNPSAVGQIFTNGSSNTGTTNVMFATSRYGKGKVAAIGDSSPCDDGTGASGNNLYDGYIGDASGNHQKLLINATIWLATQTITTDIVNSHQTTEDFQVYPNPVTNGILKIQLPTERYTPALIELFDAAGNALISAKASGQSIEIIDVSHLSTGFYFCKLSSANSSSTKKVFIQK